MNTHTQTDPSTHIIRVVMDRTNTCACISSYLRARV